MPRELNIKPTVGLLAMMKNMDYTEYYAIAEFVANSVQSYWENKKKLQSVNSNYKLKVKIELTPTELTIKDNAGGISDSRYDAAFEAGKPPQSSSKSLETLTSISLSKHPKSRPPAPLNKLIA